jgi:hypothetical protein
MIFEVLSGHDILKGKLIQFPPHRCRNGSGEGAKSVKHVAPFGKTVARSRSPFGATLLAYWLTLERNVLTRRVLFSI